MRPPVLWERRQSQQKPFLLAPWPAQGWEGSPHPPSPVPHEGPCCPPVRPRPAQPSLRLRSGGTAPGGTYPPEAGGSHRCRGCCGAQVPATDGHRRSTGPPDSIAFHRASPRGLLFRRPQQGPWLNPLGYRLPRQHQASWRFRPVSPSLAPPALEPPLDARRPAALRSRPRQSGACTAASRPLAERAWTSRAPSGQRASANVRGKGSRHSNYHTGDAQEARQ